MERARSLLSIPDDELLRRLHDLLRQSRHGEADLVAHIGEVDERRLYAREASPSMFVYCTEVLHLSEAEAYLRITAARASREHPALLDMLRDGRLHLSGIAKLVPHLTEANASTLLHRATHRSKRQILELVAELVPRPDAPTVIRKLPDRPLLGPASQSAPQQVDVAPQGLATPTPQLRPDRVDPCRSFPAPPTVVEPLAPGRYKVQFTASAQLRDKLERLQALMSSPALPVGDLATIIEAAVTEKLERLEAKRFALTKAPRKVLRETKTIPTSRHIPAAVQRAVHERDGHRCRFVDGRGRRCTERKRLEFHHRHPFGMGGDHSSRNIALLCPAHNLLLAENDYGRGAMGQYRGPRRAAVAAEPG